MAKTLKQLKEQIISEIDVKVGRIVDPPQSNIDPRNNTYSYWDPVKGIMITKKRRSHKLQTQK